MTVAVSFILVLESLVFYSVGSVIIAGKSAELRPRIIDLIILSFMWAAAICTNTILDLNKWLLISAWAILSILTGVLATWPRKLPRQTTTSYETSKPLPRNIFKRIWHGWENFNIRLAGFQTRMIFSLFFFILISPVALAAKIFQDPLSLKNIGDKSHWLTKDMAVVSLEQFRKQF